MHGLWFLFLVPPAAVVAWRLNGPLLKRTALLVAAFAFLGLIGWFGYLSWVGADFTDTLFARAKNGFQVIVGYVDIPLTQVGAAALTMVCWPKSWTWSSKEASEIPMMTVVD